MESISYAGYVEELPMHELSPLQFRAILQEAAESLGWLIAAGDEHTLICRTPPSLHSQGELIHIALTQDKAVFQSVPVSEYFWSEAQHRENADRLKELLATLAVEQELKERSRHPMHREKFGALIPSKTYLVTPLIVYSIALVYLVMVLSGISPLQPTADSLLQWGGSFREAIVHGQWWRLITYMFLHAGVMHLLMNTYALLYIGMFLEPLIGRFRLLAAYLLTGICAGLMSIVMHSFSVGVGASGAIFGLYGVFLSLLTTNHLQKTAKKTMLRSILFFVVFNLLMGMQGNTDNAAHIGGLLSGILIGYVFYPGIRNKVSTRKQVWAVGLVGVGVLLLTLVTLSRLGS